MDDPAGLVGEVAEHYRAAGAAIDDLDGVTVQLGDWWFNLRPSNTEPLLRLNLEADSAPECDRHVAEVLDVIHRLAADRAG